MPSAPNSGSLRAALALGRVAHPEWWRAFDWIEAEVNDETRADALRQADRLADYILDPNLKRLDRGPLRSLAESFRRALRPEPEPVGCRRCDEEYVGAGWALDIVAKMPHTCERGGVLK